MRIDSVLESLLKLKILSNYEPQTSVHHHMWTTAFQILMIITTDYLQSTVVGGENYVRVMKN